MVSPPKFVNHYEALGLITPTNDLGTIKRAWRFSCWLAHPDRGGSDEKQARVNIAWDVLRDDKRRAAYIVEYRRFFETPYSPMPPRAPLFQRQPGTGSAGLFGDGSRPTRTSPSRPSSGSRSAKRPAEETPLANSKRPRMFDAHSSSSRSPNKPRRNRDNNFEEGLPAAFRFVPQKAEVMTMVVDKVARIMEEMGTTRLERDIVCSRLLKPGSGVDMVAACVVETMEDLR